MPRMTTYAWDSAFRGGRLPLAGSPPGQQSEESLNRKPRPERDRRDLREVLGVNRHVDVRRVDGQQCREQPPAGAATRGLRQDRHASRELGNPARHDELLPPAREVRRHDRLVLAWDDEVHAPGHAPEDRRPEPGAPPAATRSSTSASTSKLACTPWTSSFSSRASIRRISVPTRSSSTGVRVVGRWTSSAESISTPASSSAFRTAASSAGPVTISQTSPSSATSSAPASIAARRASSQEREP